MRNTRFALTIFCLFFSTLTFAVDKNDLVGGWTFSMDMFEGKAGLHANGEYHSVVNAFMGMQMIDVGTWAVEQDQLVVTINKHYQVMQANVKEESKSRTMTRPITEVTGNTFTTEHTNALDEVVKTTYSKTDEIYRFTPPSKEAALEKQKEEISANCRKMYNGGLYYSALIMCETAANLGDAKAALNMAYMHWAGQGTKADKTLAKAWYKKARDAGNETAQQTMNAVLTDYLKRWPYGTSQNKESLVGSWCSNAVGLKKEQLVPDGARLVLKDDGNFTYGQAMQLSGKWSFENGKLDLGEQAGTFEVKEQSPDELWLSLGGLHQYVRGNCGPDVKNQVTALLLDNAIVTNNRHVIDTIISSGHDINMANTSGGTEPTPLIQAIKSGNLELAKELIAMGADPAKPDFMDRTPLDIARKQGNEKMQALIENAVKAGTVSVNSKKPPIQAIPAIPEGSFSIKVPESVHEAARLKEQQRKEMEKKLASLTQDDVYAAEPTLDLIKFISCQTIKYPNRSNEETEKVYMAKARELGIGDSEQKLELTLHYYTSNEDFMATHKEAIGEHAMKCLFGG